MAKKSKKQLVEDLVGDFKRARKYTKENYHDIWDDAWKTYNGQRVHIGYEGNSDTFVPETFKVLENICDVSLKNIKTRESRELITGMQADLFNAKKILLT